MTYLREVKRREKDGCCRWRRAGSGQDRTEMEEMERGWIGERQRQRGYEAGG